VTPAEHIAAQFHAAYERLAPGHGYKTREASAVPWEEVPEANKNLMIAVAQDLLDRGVINGGTGIDRYRTRQADAAEFVQDLARSAGYDKIEGFVILYAFREGIQAFGIGSVASDGQVWDALKRINEKQLAGHLFAALRAEQSAQNGGGGLILPG
jgi:hypothetical protein